MPKVKRKKATKRMKPWTGWAVVRPNGQRCTTLIFLSRRDAEQEAREWRIHGIFAARIARVTVREGRGR